ncbi:TerD family protein [Deinococcus humi]|uniref:Tellurite resistance protein TerA n=1 Tax=Deinococcus humi TaxID=662880 RepID=A0A7W8JQT6_9DEIO|nr:TerD family protein [Deinococcus humi]MBB5361492.1 tellurite resistance protein TerA [Deinococcus humi]GGO20347.1 tellurium resistance protein TerA [Deinococcus humi]
MQTFQTGQKAQLSTLTPQTNLTLTVQVTGPASEYDLILFGLDAAGKLSDDRYMVFFNQPRSPEGAIEMRGGARNEKVFQVDLSRLPASVRRLSLASTVDSGAFNAIDHAQVTLSSAGSPLMTYRVTGRDFQQQKAVMLLDLYFKDVWRVGAVGQGFNGGLEALVNHFGGTVADTPAGRPPTVTVPPPAPTPAAPRPAPTVNLGKITLDKQGQSARISLRKDGQKDPIRVNLNWDKGGGFLRPGADLDLGCMFVMQDGQKGVIQALGNSFGSDRFEPFILLDKDDRSGASSDGENLIIFRPDLIHTVVIFAFIYQGTSDFTKVNGRLTMKDPRGNEITVQLSNPDMRRTFCAIASIENAGGEVKITKEERYFKDHQEADQHFGFGFRWTAGSK